MPEVRHNSQGTPGKTDLHSQSMALRQMGDRPNRTIAPCTWGLRFAIVAVDYYTKWAEAKALTTTTEAACTKFLWDHIVCRSGVPHSIVFDNGKQFDNAATRRFCEGLGIRKDFSVPIHPQSNGQVEAVNKILKYTLKKRLDDLKEDGSRNFPKSCGHIEQPAELQQEKPLSP